MFVDIVLLFISFLITWKAFFPEMNIKNEFLKKILFKSIAVLFLLFSIINIYNTNHENQNLIDTAKEILAKTDTINFSLEENLTLVKESSNEINNTNSNLKIIGGAIGISIKVVR